MQKKSFLRLGDHPLLDFCNTLICHGERDEEHLLAPQSAEQFMSDFFSVKHKIDSKAFESLLRLRSLLRRYFYFLLKLEASNPTAELNSWLERYPLTLAISTTGEAHYKTVKEQHIFAPLIASIESFLTSLDQTRLRKCANPNCSHLFYDVSKNNKRQWCSMKSCGNIMKARAFYARKKEQKEE